MRQLLITITLALAVMFSGSVSATAAPDFSGTWVLNAAKSTLPKDSTIKSQTISIENKKSAIIFHYKTDGKKLTETYTPDGKKRVALKMPSGQLTSSASWNDSVLVIESTLDIKIPNATVVVTGLKPVVDTWTLAGDGRTLTHDAGDHKEIYVYEKQ
jgi:flagellar hook assembly protein FlgD